MKAARLNAIRWKGVVFTSLKGLDMGQHGRKWLKSLGKLVKVDWTESVDSVMHIS